MSVFDLVVRIGFLGPVRMVVPTGGHADLEACLAQLRMLVAAPVEVVSAQTRLANLEETVNLVPTEEPAPLGYPISSEG